MNKICFIYNYAQHYRKDIFTLIDKEFPCDFYFGDKMDDVKKMDYCVLNNSVTEVENKTIFSHIIWQVGIWKLIFKKEYSHFIMLGQVDSLSTWLIAFLGFILRGKKIYFWMHGWYGDEVLIKKILKKIFFFFSNGIFLYGNYARNLMIKEGISFQKLHVIYNSLYYDTQIKIRECLIESNVYSDYFNNNHSNLIFIGRLTQIKNLPLLIKAMSISAKENTIYNLTIIGDGEQRSEIKDIVEEFDLKNNVHFYGSCYNEQEIAELIYNADLCVSPGNVGLTAIHCITYGTPVLTHNNFSKQMPEFEAIEVGKSGYFFDYEDVNSLSQMMAYSINYIKNNRQQIRDYCFKIVDEKYNPHIQIEIIKNILSAT
jgi:glycosyltransferase involved in cell wall biosynthesis